MAVSVTCAVPPELRISAGWAMGARVLGAIAFAANNAFLARVLGPENFGYFAVAANVAVFAGFIAVAGLNRHMLRAIAAAQTVGTPGALLDEWRGAKQVLRFSFPATGALVGCTVLLIGQPFDAEILALAFLVAVLTMSQGAQSLAADSLRGFGEVRLASLLDGRGGGAAVILVHSISLLPWVLAHRTLPLTAALALNLLAFALVLLPARRVLADRWRSVRRHVVPGDSVSPELSASLLGRSAVALTGTQLVAFLGMQADVWIAGAVLPAQQVSAYAAAQRLMILVSMPLLAAQFAASPAIAGLMARRRTRNVEHLLRSLATIAGVPTAALLAFVVAFRHPILTLLFGPAYAVAGLPLVWLAFGQAVNVATGLCGVVLIMSGHERVVLRLSALLVTVGLLADLLAARTLGMPGLAAASGISTATLFVAYWIVARRMVGVWTHPGFPSSEAAK
jgi:O-antigen/teichoic acid export membrane protein